MRRFGFAVMLFVACMALAPCLVPSRAVAAPNPFVAPGSGGGREAPADASASPSFMSGFMVKVARAQLAIRSGMVSAAHEIKIHPFGRAFWWFMLLSFAYGVVHAMGPGHGKLLAASYFMNRPGSLALGAMFGYLTMFFHVLSAAVLVLGGAALLRAWTPLTGQEVGAGLETAAYVLLVLLGLFMLARSLASLFRPRAALSEAAPAGRKELVLFSLAAGLAPCPGSALVLTFSVSLGITAAGLTALGAIALGMGLTVSLASAVAIVARGALLKRLKGGGRGYVLAQAGLGVLGALLILGMGLVMLAGRV